MKIVSVKSCSIPDVRVIRFQRFTDLRGYFTESFRRSDFDGSEDVAFLKGLEFVQVNESFSKPGVVRGLHFQWNPYMGKLVRTAQGRMVDLFLDIRKGSPTFGQIAACDMPASPEDEFGEWIWVPPGFAHGNCFTAPTIIEYFCTGQYSPGCEACISPLAEDLDWSLCDEQLTSLINATVNDTELITDKDRDGFTLAAWDADERSDNFIYGRC